MTELIVFLGVQLSGKTTLARVIAQRKQYTFISIDSIRKILYGYLSGPKDWTDIKAEAAHNEKTKTAYDLFFQITENALLKDRSVVIEMPHLGQREEELIDRVKYCKASIKIIWCFISNDSDEEIKRRIRKRDAEGDLAQVRLQDYRMFKNRTRKPARLPFLELDTSQPQNVCLEKIDLYIRDPL